MTHPYRIRPGTVIDLEHAPNMWHSVPQIEDAEKDSKGAVRADMGEARFSAFLSRDKP